MKFLDRIRSGWVTMIWRLTPDCADMARLSSLGCDRVLPLRTRIRMRLHFLICVWCRRYQKQLGFLRQAASDHPELLHEAVPRRLSPEARERLARALRDPRHGRQ